MSDTVNEARIVSALRSQGLIDEPKLKLALADGSARGWRNAGEKTYLDMCKLWDVKPHVPAVRSVEVVNSLRKRLVGRRRHFRDRVKEVERMIAELDNKGNES